jgi:hypothetical protein
MIARDGTLREVELSFTQILPPTVKLSKIG